MQNGQWTLNFTMLINGETSTGEPVNLEKNIQVELLATNEQEAEKQAGLIVNQIEEKSEVYDIDFFKKYESAIENEDTIECKDFFLNFKKPLDVKIPKASYF